MKHSLKKPDVSELLLSLPEFVLSYNRTIPETFPRASSALLLRYRGEHAMFFKHKDQWSLSEHRKKIMDWLPLNSKTA